ncbi:hypothetical protein PR048_011904 [Dryococelus australis]|uniref:Uncharacterized protein n=1 Tax=Dryococelus australis TaxID=614101 RepID=A0ABQ9HMU1_9NEOP|nr:hypothetical protein PR048_011904 [Dryococelus australis]
MQKYFCKSKITSVLRNVQHSEINQNIFLLGKIHAQDVTRRRRGLYDYPSTSRRQFTITYGVPHGNGKYVRFTENYRNLIRAHITTFSRHDVPQNVYMWIFKCRLKHESPDFPKFKFAHSVVYSCNKCDQLKATITCSTTENKKSETRTNLEQHHMNTEEAQECMRTDFNSS